MTLTEPVLLSEGVRTQYGLLTSALPLPDGWESGIEFNASGCSEPEIVAQCEVTDTPVNPVEGVRFDPALIRVSASCSTLGAPIGAQATDRLTSTTEWGLGRVLATGVGTDNPSFADAESITSAANAVDAVSCLEQGVADVGFGARGYLHAPPRAAAYLMDHGLIDANGFSPSGHRWIISAGYPAPASDAVTIWATGTVWVGVGNPESFDTPAWRQNLNQVFQQRPALAAFDPCLLLAASFTVAACTGGS